MTRQFLPKQIEPRKLAQQKMLISGELALADMPRVTHLLANTDSDLQVELNFSIDISVKRPTIEGQLTGEVSLVCQRCSEAYQHPINLNFLLSPVTNESESDELPAHLEPVVVVEERVNTIDMIEDELLLNLPLVPKHLPEHCGIELVEAVDKPLKRNDNPFEILKGIKTS